VAAVRNGAGGSILAVAILGVLAALAVSPFVLDLDETDDLEDSPAGAASR